MANSQSIKISCDLPEGIGQGFELRYRVFGSALHHAPIVLVNHALTGNSNVAGENGWWNQLIGENKAIDLKHYTVIAFDIPGNMHEGTAAIKNHKSLTTKIIADLFWRGLEALGIRKLHTIIGGSLGGGISWEMAILKPNSIQNLIPVASNIKSSDWLIGNVQVQDYILNNATKPVQAARQHAMLLYRTPQSMAARFERKKTNGEYAVENWLNYHGETLNQRFQLDAYKTMNHLLKTIGQDLTDEELINFAQTSNIKIHIITVDSDYLFTKEEQYQLYQLLKDNSSHVHYHEIKSIHGHDGFLIEYEQLSSILHPLFALK